LASVVEKIAGSTVSRFSSTFALINLEVVFESDFHNLLYFINFANYFIIKLNIMPLIKLIFLQKL
jgi:hypothetical protein